MHLPGGAGNFLVQPVRHTSLHQDYYYNTWLHVAPSVIDQPPTPDCPNSGLCFDRCPFRVPPARPPCDGDPSPAHCYPVPDDHEVFAVSTTLRDPVNGLEAAYTGGNHSTRSCRRRLQVETIEPPPLVASTFTYIDACSAAGLNPATVLASCDAGIKDAGCDTTRAEMAENCAYDYCATGDNSFINAYKDICAIDANEKLLLLRPLPSPPPPPKTYRPIQPLWGGQCAIPGQSVSSYCCSYTEPTLNTQQDCENKCNADAKCVAYSWKISYTDCQVYDAAGLPDLDAVVGSRSLSPPQGHWDASCYVVLPPPPPSSAVLTLTASGSVSDFTESDRSSLQQKVANVAGVDKSLVKINVTASSVLITATIAVPASMTADQVKTSLSSSLGTADAASIALGITVEAVPNIIIKGPPPSPPPSILSVSCAALDDRTTCTKEDSKTVHRRCSPSAKTGWGGVDHKKCAKLCKNMDERLSAKCKQACCVTPPPSPPPSPESCDDPSFTLPACVAGVKPTADHPGSTKKDKFCVSNTLVTCAVSCGTCSPPPPPSPEA